jgi:hypothetical protein
MGIVGIEARVLQYSKIETVIGQIIEQERDREELIGVFDEGKDPRDGFAEHGSHDKISISEPRAPAWRKERGRVGLIVIWAGVMNMFHYDFPVYPAMKIDLMFPGQFFHLYSLERL